MINKTNLTIQRTKLFNTVENEKTSESKIQIIVKIAGESACIK
jgi:hypothetical protein